MAPDLGVVVIPVPRTWRIKKFKAMLKVVPHAFNHSSWEEAETSRTEFREVQNYIVRDPVSSSSSSSPSIIISSRQVFAEFEITLCYLRPCLQQYVQKVAPNKYYLPSDVSDLQENSHRFRKILKEPISNKIKNIKTQSYTLIDSNTDSLYSQLKRQVKALN